MRRRRAIALAAFAVLGPGSGVGRAQPLPPKALVEADSCSILIPAVGYDMEDPAQARQASEDVLRVKAALEAALAGSPDMRAKVAEACRDDRNGRRGHPELDPKINIFVYRDDPRVDQAVANPAGAGEPGNMVLDLGDLDAMGDYFQPGSDPGLVQEITKNALTRALAHEFDHLRDSPDRGRWGRNHGDPLGHRDEQGEPVRDANTVIVDLHGKEVRTAYGGDLISFRGLRPGPHAGKVAVLRYTDLVSRGRTARSGGGGSGFGAPLPLDGEAVGALPAEPCTGAAEGCYPSPTTGDADLDGIADDADLCPELANPWMLDADGDGKGDDCQPRESLDPAHSLTDALNSPLVAEVGGHPLYQIMFVYAEPREDRSGVERADPVPGGALPRVRADEPSVWITALGGSTGAVARVTVADPDGVLGDLGGGMFVAEPVELEPGERMEHAREIARAEAEGARSRPVSAYCLEMRRLAPAAGTPMRIADALTQRRFEGVGPILEASHRVERSGGLHPDGDPTGYAHAIRQWAIWTRIEDLDYDQFVESVLAYARKNYERTGQSWNDDVADAIRSLLPNRWGDVQTVLEGAGGL